MQDVLDAADCAVEQAMKKTGYMVVELRSLSNCYSVTPLDADPLPSLYLSVQHGQETLYVTKKFPCPLPGGVLPLCGTKIEKSLPLQSDEEVKRVVSDLLCKPLVITVFETFSQTLEGNETPGHTVHKLQSKKKDKLGNRKKATNKSGQQLKQEEFSADNKVVVGCCTVDLLPIIIGNKEIEGLVEIWENPLIREAGEKLSPRLDYRVSLRDTDISILAPLSPTTMIANHDKTGNIMTISMKCMYVGDKNCGAQESLVPELRTGFQSLNLNNSRFIAITPTLSKGKEETELKVFSNGIAVDLNTSPSGHRASSYQWPDLDNARYGAEYMTKNIFKKQEKCVTGGLNLGQSIDNIEFVNVLNSDKNVMISWNMQHRTYLDAEDRKELHKSIEAERYWPIQIFCFCSELATPAMTQRHLSCKSRNAHARQLSSRQSKHAKDQMLDKPGDEPVFVDDETNNSICFHGIAFLDVSELLLPGVTKVCGAVKVNTYYDESASQTGKNSENYMNIARTCIEPRLSMDTPAESNLPVHSHTGTVQNVSGKHSPCNQISKPNGEGSSKSTTPRKLDQNMNKRNIAKKGRKITPHNEQVDLSKLKKKLNIFDDYSAYITVEFELFTSLVSPTERSTLERMVEDYIHTSSKSGVLNLDTCTDLNTIHLQNFDNLIVKLAKKLIKLHRDQSIIHLTNGTGNGSHDSNTDADKFYIYLKERGVIQDIENELLISIKDIYKTTWKFPSETAEPCFNKDKYMVNLYSQLLTRLHLVFNSMFELQPECSSTSCSSEKKDGIENQDRSEVAKTDAKELYTAGEISLAENCLLKNLYDLLYSSCPINKSYLPTAWLLLGMFYLLQRIEKAHQCFLHALSHTLNDVECLLMTAASSFLLRQVNDAENIAHLATYIDNNSFLAFTVLGIIQYENGQQTRAQKSLRSAEDLYTSQNSSVPSTLDPRGKSLKPDTIYLVCAEYMVHRNVSGFALLCLSYELNQQCTKMADNPTPCYYYMRGQAMAQLGKHDLSDQDMSRASMAHITDAKFWYMWGQVKVNVCDFQNACKYFQRSLDYPSSDMTKEEQRDIYICLGKVYMKMEAWFKAQEALLSVVNIRVSWYSFYLLGKVSLEIGQLDLAEQALSDSNRLAPTQPGPWAYLALVSHKKGNLGLAEVCKAHAKSLGISTRDEERITREFSYTTDGGQKH